MPNKSSTDEDQLQSSSNEHLHKKDKSKQFLQVTPKPRSFSDIFSAPKMVLVKKNNVQNNPSLMPTGIPSKNVQTSVTTSTTASSTKTFISSTTLAPPTTISSTLRLLKYIYFVLRHEGIITCLFLCKTL